MSTLTKEEREFECPNCRTRFRPAPKVDPRELVEGSIIDRLMAENEELRKKLTALIEAAEMVLEGRRLEKHDEMMRKRGRVNPQGIIEDSLWFLDVKVLLLRNLNKAVKEAKENG